MSARYYQHADLVGVVALVTSSSPARVFAVSADARRVVAFTCILPELIRVGESAVLAGEPGSAVMFSSAIWVNCTDGNVRKLTVAATPVLSATYDLGSTQSNWIASYGSALLLSEAAGTLISVSSSGVEIDRAEGLLPKLAMAAVSSGTGYVYLFDGQGQGAIASVSSAGLIAFWGTFAAPNVVNIKQAVVNGNELIIVCDDRRLIYSVATATVPLFVSEEKYTTHLTSVGILSNGNYYFAARTPPETFDYLWAQGPCAIKNGLIVGMPSVGGISFANPVYSEDGDSITITTLAVPAAPVGLIAMGSNARVDLSWTLASNVTYSVYRGTASGIYTLLTSALAVAAYADTTTSNGTTYYYAITATNATGDSDYSSEVSATPSASAPLNTVAPVASGTARVGQTLSCTDGTWTGDAVIVFTYQWRRDGADIAAATNATYVAVLADLDTAVDCVVTGTNGAGATPKDSNNLQIIAAPVNTVAPVMSGGPLVGQVVSCTTGTWTGSPTIVYTYQWRRGGVSIGGATASTHLLVSGDDGTSVDCLVTATNAAGNASQDSNNIAVGSLPANTVAPAATGTATVGQTLSCTTGTWTGTATISYAYQWRRDGVSIGSATASTYVLVSADAATTVDCLVTATNSYGSVSADSNDKSVIAGTSLTWTSRTSSGNRTWHGVAYGAGTFVAVSADSSAGTGNIMYSTDAGVTWTSANMPSNVAWTDVAYGNGTFVAVANSGGTTPGVNNQVATSADGIAWTTRLQSHRRAWLGITYGNGVFVAVADTQAVGSGQQIMISTDNGVNWTGKSAPAVSDWSGVAYGNSTFVAVAYGGAGNRVMTSSDDGATWTGVAAPAANSWADVVFGNGSFVAIAFTGTNRSMVSTDNGANWTAYAASTARTWVSIAYGAGLFVATATDGTTDSAMASTDGTSWVTSTTAPTTRQWRGVAYGGGTFVAVSQTGTGNRAMTVTP